MCKKSTDEYYNRLKKILNSTEGEGNKVDLILEGAENKKFYVTLDVGKLVNEVIEVKKTKKEQKNKVVMEEIVKETVKEAIKESRESVIKKFNLLLVTANNKEIARLEALIKKGVVEEEKKRRVEAGRYSKKMILFNLLIGLMYFQDYFENTRVVRFCSNVSIKFLKNFKCYSSVELLVDKISMVGINHPSVGKIIACLKKNKKAILIGTLFIGNLFYLLNKTEIRKKISSFGFFSSVS